MKAPAIRRLLSALSIGAAALAAGALVHRAGVDPQPAGPAAGPSAAPAAGASPAASGPAAAPMAQGAGEQPDPRRAGQDLLAMQFSQVDGVVRSVAQSLPGRGVRVVNFWATWCAPCVEEMPLLSAWASGRGTEAGVVGIAIDTVPGVERFLKKHPVAYPILIGTPAVTSQFARLGNPQGLLPFTVVLGPDGGVVETALGKVDSNWLDKLLK